MLVEMSARQAEPNAGRLVGGPRERLVAAARRLEQAKRERDELIVAASEAGMTRRKVAAAVGLSPAGVQYVVDRYQVREGDQGPAPRAP